MIDFDHWLTQLDDGEEQQEREWHTNQEELFLEYVLREETAYRKDLKERFDRGEKLTGPKGLRKKLAAVDLSYFGRAYLSHYFVRKSPEFHAELDAIWESGVLKGMNPLMDAKKISRADGSKRAIAAPRGHAKSTNFTFKDSLHAILYAYKHYLIILSDSSDQAEAFLEDIKDELEDNADIIEDFGCMKGEDTWKSGTIKTTNGVKVDAVGSGKKLRGRKNRSWRPDLIVLDDIENDENVNTPEQRKKLLNWFNKAVMKAGDTYTDIMYVGTILHYDSLLSNTLKNPEFKSRKYRAVISYADNTQLWEQWEELFVNLFDELHEEHADEFFEEHKTEMLKGTQVLWEEKLSYYKLMKMKVSEGKLAEKDMKLNKKKTRIYSLRKGILFLGFWFYLTDTGKVMVHIDPKKVKHERRKLRRMAGLVKKGEKTREQVDEHFDSWMRHASYGDSYNFQKNMREFYRSLWEDNDNDGIQETQRNDRG